MPAVAKKRPIQVYLRPEQIDALRDRAERRKVTVGELVRESVDRLLGDELDDRDPLDGIIGMANSGLGDLAARHDYYLAKWAREDHRE